MDTDCLFCKIGSREIPSDIIQEDEQVLVFLDIHPVNPGHALVIPKTHFRNILETPAEVSAYIIETAKRIARALLDAKLADGVNITSNNEKAAGQIIFHTHIHVIPRLSVDGFKHWKGRGYAEGEAEMVRRSGGIRAVNIKWGGA